MIPLDLIAGGFSLEAGAACFAQHYMTARRNQQWHHLPRYLRNATLWMGVFLMCRGFDLCYLAFGDGKGPGHANWVSAMSWGVCAWYFTAAAIYVHARRGDLR